MGKHKLAEFLQDLGRRVESRAGNKSQPKPRVGVNANAPGSGSGSGLSKSQKKKQKKKRSLLNKTVDAAALNQARSEVETIIFRDPLKPAPGSKENANANKKRGKKASQNQEDGADDVIDIRKASFEVIKFSINSMKGSEKEDAETKLAISLGAEPPKNKYINYKELQEIRKAEKQAKQEQEKHSMKPDLKSHAIKNSQARPSPRMPGKGKPRLGQNVSMSRVKRYFKGARTR